MAGKDDGTTTFRTATLIIMALSLMTLSITTFSNTIKRATHRNSRVVKLIVIYGECCKQAIYVECRYDKGRYAECRGAMANICTA